jgi:hypothetical protein
VTRQSPGEMNKVKAAVRERDNHRCVHCGMTNEQHVAERGRQLQVHRKTPGSHYTVDGCETVCVSCHHGLPERGPDQPDLAHGSQGWRKVRLDVRDQTHDELRVLAARSGLSMAAYCEMLVEEAVERDRVLKPKKEKK